MAKDVFKIQIDNQSEKSQSFPETNFTTDPITDQQIMNNNNEKSSTPTKTMVENDDKSKNTNILEKNHDILKINHHHHHHYEDAPSEENISFEVPGSNASGHLLTHTNTSLLTLKANLFSCIASMLFLVFGVIFNLAVLAIIHERVPFGEPPLPDVSFDLLPKQDSALFISEYIIMFMSTSVIILIIFHQYRWIIFTRLCVILAILYIYRALCMAVTQVPVSNQQYYCSPRLNLTEIDSWEMTKVIMWRIVFMSVGMGLSVNGHHTFCGDFIFSGHTVILVISDLFLVYYWLSNRKKFGFILIKYCYHLLVVIGIVAILVARGHYLVDIVLGLVISKLIFYLYHILCHYTIMQSRYMEPLSMIHHENGSMVNHHSSDVVTAATTPINITIPQHPNPLNTWWFNLFHFFEYNSIKNRIIVENRFEWPLLFCSRQSNMMMI